MLLYGHNYISWNIVHEYCRFCRQFWFGVPNPTRSNGVHWCNSHQVELDLLVLLNKKVPTSSRSLDVCLVNSSTRGHCSPASSTVYISCNSNVSLSRFCLFCSLYISLFPSLLHTSAINTKVSFVCLAWRTGTCSSSVCPLLKYETESVPLVGLVSCFARWEWILDPKKVHYIHLPWVISTSLRSLVCACVCVCGEHFHSSQLYTQINETCRTIMSTFLDTDSTSLTVCRDYNQPNTCVCLSALASFLRASVPFSHGVMLHSCKMFSPPPHTFLLDWIYSERQIMEHWTKHQRFSGILTLKHLAWWAALLSCSRGVQSL